jgi:hypothetical protein
VSMCVPPPPVVSFSLVADRYLCDRHSLLSLLLTKSLECRRRDHRLTSSSSLRDHDDDDVRGEKKTRAIASFRVD